MTKNLYMAKRRKEVQRELQMVEDYLAAHSTWSDDLSQDKWAELEREARANAGGAGD